MLEKQNELKRLISQYSEEYENRKNPNELIEKVISENDYETAGEVLNAVGRRVYSGLEDNTKNHKDGVEFLKQSALLCNIGGLGFFADAFYTGTYPEVEKDVHLGRYMVEVISHVSNYYKSIEYISKSNIYGEINKKTKQNFPTFLRLQNVIGEYFNLVGNKQEEEKYNKILQKLEQSNTQALTC